MAFTLGKCRNQSNLLQTNADICRTSGKQAFTLSATHRPLVTWWHLTRQMSTQQSLPHCGNLLKSHVSSMLCSVASVDAGCCLSSWYKL